MGNAFLNAVETSQQESAFLTMQMAVTRMSRDVSFISTSQPNDRTFLLKDYATLKDMDPESYDIQSHNLLSEYKHRPKALENYCLADFVSELRIEYPKNVTFEDPFEDNFDDDPPNADERQCTGQTGIEITKWNCYKKEKSTENIEICELQCQERPRESLQRKANAFPPMEK